MEQNKAGRTKKSTTETEVFQGFTLEELKGEYIHLPSVWLDVFSAIDNLAELKVVLYVMRHTWGFREYEELKRISVDEFVHGRKRKGGGRVDHGTGLSDRAVVTGINKAVEHGYIEVEIDNSDKARIKKHYRLKIKKQVQSEPDVILNSATETPILSKRRTSGISAKYNSKPKNQSRSNISQQINKSIQLQTMPYVNYLQSPEWQTKREQALRLAEYRCQICNASGSLHVHHRSYERRGREAMSDLIVLCGKCHELFHQSSELSQD